MTLMVLKLAVYIYICVCVKIYPDNVYTAGTDVSTVRSFKSIFFILFYRRHRVIRRVSDDERVNQIVSAAQRPSRARAQRERIESHLFGHTFLTLHCAGVLSLKSKFRLTIRKKLTCFCFFYRRTHLTYIRQREEATTSRGTAKLVQRSRTDKSRARTHNANVCRTTHVWKCTEKNFFEILLLSDNCRHANKTRIINEGRARDPQGSFPPTWFIYLFVDLNYKTFC